MYMIVTVHPIGALRFATRAEAHARAEAFGLPVRWVHLNLRKDR